MKSPFQQSRLKKSTMISKLLFKTLPVGKICNLIAQAFKIQEIIVILIDQWVF